MLGPGRTHSKLTPTIGTVAGKDFRARPAECAFKGANPGVVAIWRQIPSAMLAIGSHIQHDAHPLDPASGISDNIASSSPLLVGAEISADVLPNSRSWAWMVRYRSNPCSNKLLRPASKHRSWSAATCARAGTEAGAGQNLARPISPKLPVRQLAQTKRCKGSDNVRK